MSLIRSLHFAMSPLTSALTVFSFATAHAGGFEKNVMWSGRYAGQAGAAAANVEGSESLYFNPAGLVRGSKFLEVTANLSPTISQYEAPITTSNKSVKAEEGMSPIFGLTAKYTLNEKISLGAGFYVAGGTHVLYKNVNVGTPADFESNIQATEASLGLGYKVSDQLRLGLAWRLTMVNATFNYGAPSPPVAVTNKGLEGFQFTGFRLGAQYSAHPDLELGMSYRSGVEFEVKGRTNISLGPASGDVSVESSLPQQLTLGAAYKVNSDWSAFGEYVWTNYSAIQEFEFDRVGAGALQDTAIAANWNDQHNIRLAGEYRGLGLPIRAGYVFTTSAVPTRYAQATFSTPGLAHTLTAGSGFSLLQNKLILNGSLEYSFSSAKVTNNINTTGGNGDYSSTAMAAHLGATYSF